MNKHFYASCINDKQYIKTAASTNNNVLLLTLVKANGLIIEFVKDPTEELYVAALRQNGSVLKFIAKQTEELCLISVKKNIERCNNLKKYYPGLTDIYMSLKNYDKWPIKFMNDEALKQRLIIENDLNSSVII